jgi:hypothetical protein
MIENIEKSSLTFDAADAKIGLEFHSHAAVRGFKTTPARTVQSKVQEDFAAGVTDNGKGRYVPRAGVHESCR